MKWPSYSSSSSSEFGTAASHLSCESMNMLRVISNYFLNLLIWDVTVTYMYVWHVHNLNKIKQWICWKRNGFQQFHISGWKRRLLRTQIDECDTTQSIRSLIVTSSRWKDVLSLSSLYGYIHHWILEYSTTRLCTRTLTVPRGLLLCAAGAGAGGGPPVTSGGIFHRVESSRVESSVSVQYTTSTAYLSVFAVRRRCCGLALLFSLRHQTCSRLWSTVKLTLA